MTLNREKKRMASNEAHNFLEGDIKTRAQITNHYQAITNAKNQI
jgi:hypothetical protein